MRYVYDRLIPQNVAPKGATEIVVEGGDKEVCRVPLGDLAMPSVGTKRGSVGILSDTHTETTASRYSAERNAQSEDSQIDLARAVKYFSGVAQVLCVCGDLVSYNDQSDDNGKLSLTLHKEIVDANKGDLKVLEIAGNHEHYSGTGNGGVSIISDEDIRPYTGYPLRYIEEIDGNIYIMCGSSGWYAAFDKASLQWLYEQLEAYRNKRCFLFVHGFIEGPQYCGDSADLCTWTMIDGNYKTAFIALLKHYKNAIYFHGHAHAMLQMQDYLQGLEEPRPANYDCALGVHSVHIPALAYPRDISTGAASNKYGESQGYLMDIYDNYVVLNGLDFANGTTDSGGVYKPAIIPIATYCLDTTLHTVEAGTFTDSTGLIVT